MINPAAVNHTEQKLSAAFAEVDQLRATVERVKALIAEYAQNSGSAYAYVIQDLNAALVAKP